MIQRNTQTPEYWRNLTLSQDDVEFLHNLLLDAGSPLTTQDLAERLVAERCRREEVQLRNELSRGEMYQPKKEFAVGARVIFPALDFALGEVVEVRPGQNPEYGEFDVVTVDLGTGRRRRSFASRLAAPHKLNVDVADLTVSGDMATPEELLRGVAAVVPSALAEALTAQPGFAQFENRWLLSDLLTDVHVGHLNIVEALIEVRNTPLETNALLRELDLPAELPRDVAAFSLHSVMAADGRFDQVGAGDTRQWYLRRLEPPEALEIPESLVYRPIRYDPSALSMALQQLELELDDEWSDSEPYSTALRESAPSTTLRLTYPHLIAGTLPLNRHSRPFFPRGHGDRTMVTLIDGRWGQRFPAWAFHDSRYIAGLRPWFEQHKLPAGAYITLERRDESGEVVVDFRPRRMRREWTRWAHAVDGRLDIQPRKQEVACEHDELMIIGDDSPAEIAKLRRSPAYAEAPLEKLVYEVFTELAGLSTQGSVNARTIYSTLNVVRRCPPGPVFAALATDVRYQPVGQDEFRLAV